MEKPKPHDFEWLDREIGEVLADYEAVSPASFERAPVLKPGQPKLRNNLPVLGE